MMKLKKLFLGNTTWAPNLVESKDSIEYEGVTYPLVKL